MKKSLLTKVRKDGLAGPPQNVDDHDPDQNPQAQGHHQQQQEQEQEEEAAPQPNFINNQENPDDQQAAAGGAIQEVVLNPIHQHQEQHHYPALLIPNFEHHPFHQHQEHHDAAPLVQINLDEVDTNLELGTRKRAIRVRNVGSSDHLEKKAKVSQAEDEDRDSSEFSFDGWLCKGTDPKKPPDDDSDDQFPPSLFDLSL